MQRPPGLLPQPLDVVGFLAGHDLGDLARQHGVDGAAVAADGVGVADALAAVGVAHADSVQLERAHLAVRAVGQDLRQRHPVEAGLDRRQLRHGDPSRRDRRADRRPGYGRRTGGGLGSHESDQGGIW